MEVSDTWHSNLLRLLVLISHSSQSHQGKKSDARRLGASHVVISTRPEEMKSVLNTFDLIVDTVPCAHDINPYILTLKLDGKLVLIGQIGALEPPVNSVPIIFGRRSVAGSVIGGLPETQELLDFCGEYNILPDVEMINID